MSTNKNTTGNSNNKNTSQTTTGNNNNKGKKQQQQQGKKPYFSNAPSTRGEQNRDRDRTTDVNKKKKNSKTLFIGKIFMDDISRTDVSQQLIEHRVNYLMSVLEKYGEVEHSQNNIEANNYVLVTYKTREIAEKVLKKLRNKSEMENLMEQIKVQLVKNKIPASVCPNLLRYKFDWSDKPARIAKNAYSAKKVSYQKEEEEPKEDTKEVENGTKVAKKTTKKVKKPKMKYQKQGETETQEEEKVDEPEKKKVEEKPVVISKKVEEEKRTADAENLRREADKAKLQDELEYLSKQLKNVEAEINAENKRCKDRDVRIQNLEEDLRRVDQAKSRLERQLANERSWKKLNQDTVNQLQRELEHIHQEQQSATLRLNQSEDIEQPQQSEGRFY